MPTSKHRKGWTAARSEPKKPNSKRTKIRDALRQRGAMMHAMLAELGRNPVYENAGGSKPRGAERNGFHDRAWSKQAKAWLDTNMKRYVSA